VFWGLPPLFKNPRRGCPQRHPPQGDARHHVGVAPPDRIMIGSAVINAVQHPEREEDPRGGHVDRVDLVRHVQEENDGVEDDGHLEQVLQIVGGESNGGGGLPVQEARLEEELLGGELFRLQALRDEGKAADAHAVDPNSHRQQDGTEEGAENGLAVSVGGVHGHNLAAVQ
jgi:hypothetical protein